MENEILENKTLEYYDNHANIINEKYQHGYQISLIKSTKNSKYSIKKQNYFYLTSLVNLKPDNFILDIGCGNGQFLKFLKENGDYKYCQYFGLDLSEKQINNALENNKQYASNFTFFSKDMHEFFMAEPYADVCYFIESIGYATNLDLLLKSVSTGIKIGGKVVVKNPFKIVKDEEKDKIYQEKFKPIEEEYGYSENSLGMLPNKDFVINTFIENGFELEKFEVPEYEVATYNKILLKDKDLSSSHPEYVNHIKNKIYEDYSPNEYLECGVLVFNKVKNVIEDRNSLPYNQERYEQYTQDEPMDDVIQKAISQASENNVNIEDLQSYYNYNN